MNIRVLKVKIGYDKLTYTWTRYFKFIGLDLNNECQGRKMRLLNATTFALVIIYTLQLCKTVVHIDMDMIERSHYISGLSYSFAYLVKLLTLVRGKSELMNCIERFRNIYPCKIDVEQYNLLRFILQFRKVELLLLGLMHGVLLIVWFVPILMGFVRYLFVTAQTFEFPLLYDFQYPFTVHESWLAFLLAYFSQVAMIYAGSFIILSCDLCLFSLLTQLCMHFDLIAHRIRKIDAAEETAEQILKTIITYHHDVLNLCDDVNRIFAPSLTFSLLTTSFILCFNGFQLLDNIPTGLIIRTLLVLAYEIKQVVITCYYGEQLMEKSERLFIELYNHNWFDGSNRYKKLVLFTMCRTCIPRALNVAKISNLNLGTLKFVLTNSYQAFTVLKTSR